MIGLILQYIVLPSIGMFESVYHSAHYSDYLESSSPKSILPSPFYTWVFSCCSGSNIFLVHLVGAHCFSCCRYDTKYDYKNGNEEFTTTYTTPNYGCDGWCCSSISDMVGMLELAEAKDHNKPIISNLDTLDFSRGEDWRGAEGSLISDFPPLVAFPDYSGLLSM